MTKKDQGAGNTPARPIKTKRGDYERPSFVVKRLSGQTGRDSAAELRLQASLREKDKSDDWDDATSVDVLQNYDYAGPRRWWSDDASDGG